MDASLYVLVCLILSWNTAEDNYKIYDFEKIVRFKFLPHGNKERILQEETEVKIDEMWRRKLFGVSSGESSKRIWKVEAY